MIVQELIDILLLKTFLDDAFLDCDFLDKNIFIV